MATTAVNEWTGQLRNTFYEEHGALNVPDLDFELDGKHFRASGVDARVLQGLTDEAITIRNKDGAGDQFQNNADHCFIEGLDEVEYRVFETHLGS